jgi:hypothetical protein
MATIDRVHADGRGAEEQEPTRSGVVWTATAGVAAILGAVALAIVPRVVPSQAALCGKLAKNGLTWPLLFCVGVVLVAIAATALKRTPKLEVERRPEPEPEPKAATPDPLTREIAAELARVRGGLHDMRVEFVYVKDALARLQQSATHVEESASGESEAAIFRLAASLDQLGGRVEHELHTQRAWIAAALEQRDTSASSNGNGSSDASDPYAGSVEGRAREIDVEEGYVAAEGDMHVEVTLEDESSWKGLGVLDQLDDVPGPLSGKKSPSASPSRTMGLLDELENGIAKSAETKMARLRELLSDPEVQKAIDRQY